MSLIINLTGNGEINFLNSLGSPESSCKKNQNCEEFQTSYDHQERTENNLEIC